MSCGPQVVPSGRAARCLEDVAQLSEGVHPLGRWHKRVQAPLTGVLLQPARAEDIIKKAGLKTEGNLSALQTLALLMDTFDPTFNIVTP